MEVHPLIVVQPEASDPAVVQEGLHAFRPEALSACLDRSIEHPVRLAVVAVVRVAGAARWTVRASDGAGLDVVAMTIGWADCRNGVACDVAGRLVVFLIFERVHKTG